MNSYLKYLKYKNKYLELKNQIGGNREQKLMMQTLGILKAFFANDTPNRTALIKLMNNDLELENMILYITLDEIKRRNELRLPHPESPIYSTIYRAIMEYDPEEIELDIRFTIENLNHPDTQKRILCALIIFMSEVTSEPRTPAQSTAQSAAQSTAQSTAQSSAQSSAQSTAQSAAQSALRHATQSSTISAAEFAAVQFAARPERKYAFLNAYKFASKFPYEYVFQYAAQPEPQSAAQPEPQSADKPKIFNMLCLYEELYEDPIYNVIRKECGLSSHIQKYLPWIVHSYLNITIKFIEHIPIIMDIIEKLDKRVLPFTITDLKGYNNFHIKDPKERMDTQDQYLSYYKDTDFPMKGKPLTKEQQIQLIVDSTLVKEIPNCCTVHIPRTKEESCTLGIGTNWCTSTKTNNNKFEEYNVKGPLYIIIPTKEKRITDGERYQIHQEIPYDGKSADCVTEIKGHFNNTAFTIRDFVIFEFATPEFKDWIIDTFFISISDPYDRYTKYGTKIKKLRLHMTYIERPIKIDLIYPLLTHLILRNYIHTLVNNLPITLKYLLLYNYGQILDISILPPSLEHLIIAGTYNMPIINTNPSLKSSLTLLVFGTMYNKRIEMNVLPKSLIELTFGYRYNRRILSSAVFPESLKKLKFGNNYNKHIVYTVESGAKSRSDNPFIVKLLPDSLIDLSFGTKFDKQVNIGLPESLIKLEFGRNFNQPIEKPLPKTLQILKFGRKFNQPIILGILPESLLELKFGHEFAHSIDGVLPQSLKVLEFQYTYNQHIVIEKLPKSLERLIIHYNYGKAFKSIKKILPNLQIDYLEPDEFGVYKNQYVDVVEDIYTDFFKDINFYSNPKDDDIDDEQESHVVKWKTYKKLKEEELKQGESNQLIFREGMDSAMLEYNKKMEEIATKHQIEAEKRQKADKYDNDEFSDEESEDLSDEFSDELSDEFSDEEPEDVSDGEPDEVELKSLYKYKKSYKYADSYNEPIDIGSLPDDLEELIFGSKYNQSIAVGALPKRLKRLIFGNEYKQPINRDVLPVTLLELQFGNLYNESINIGVLQNTSLKKLKFGKGYYKPIIVGSLPPSLIYLDLGYIYNLPIDINALPPALKYLIFSDNYNKPIVHLRDEEKEDVSSFVKLLPNSITHLVFKSMFNHPIGTLENDQFKTYLPNSLTHLTLGTDFKQNINMFLPETLTHLTLSRSYISLIVLEALPKKLKRLTLSSVYKSQFEDIDIKSILPRLKTINYLD